MYLGTREVNRSLIAQGINSGVFTFTSYKADSSYLRTLGFVLGFLVDQIPTGVPWLCTEQ